MRPGYAKSLFPAFALSASLVSVPTSGREYPDCPKPLDSEFRSVAVVTRTGGDLQEPVKMDFDMDAEGNVDIYWVERTGRVRKYDAKTKVSSVLGRPANLFAGDEHGLNGIALDPAFKTNRNLYLFYSVSGMGFRIARYTLDAAGLLNNASMKILLDIRGNTQPTDWHTGGAMKFDKAGNLFISVGENKAGEAGPPNTNDLRGKILRIRPLPDGTYEIPEGNLFPKPAPGSTEPSKTRPEIYVMGVRNAYTIDYDEAGKRLLWGCVGPDNTGRPTEEHNMTDTPGFFGWPYFAGANQVLVAGKDPAAPRNTAAGNTGLTLLPPARVAVNSYNQSAAITGPVYHYTNVDSRVKLPPHFDGVWFASDFNKGTLDTIGPNATLTGRVGYARILANLRVDRPVDFKQGPDGALYVINYSGYFSTVSTTAIVRIEYTGSCRPVSLAPESGPAGNPAGPDFEARGFRVFAREGRHRLRVTDLGGRLVHAAEAVAPMEHDLEPALRGRAGVYVISIEAPSGRRSRKVTLPAP